MGFNFLELKKERAYAKIKKDFQGFLLRFLVGN